MAAWDNVQLPNAPAAPSYAAPLLDFTQLGKIPGEVFEGQQRARTTALQGAFKDGLPKNADGSLDIGAMSNTLAKLGGADAAMPLMKLQMQQQQGQQIGDAISSVGSPNGTNQPPPIPPHGIPTSSSVPVANGPVAQPQGQTEASNPTTLANIVQSKINDPNIAGRVMTALSQKLGVDPGASIDPNNPTVNAYIQSANGGVIPNGQTAGQPAQPQQVAPQASASPGFDQASMQQAQQKATLLRSIAARIANLNPKGAEAALKQAEALDAQAKQIGDVLGKNSEVTPEQKNLTSGATVKAKELEGEVAQGQKTYNGITAAASQYQRTLEPTLTIAKGILNRPEMYSGIGGDISLDFNKVKAALGAPQAAALQEGLQKINAISVLSQVNQQRDELQEAGGGSARIFSQQVDQVAKASASLQNTVYGNRFLVNFQTRMGDLSKEVAQQARDYVARHGHLDPKFDQQVSNYLNKHPVFSEQEKSDPRILGAPDAPGNISDKNGVLAWAGQMGLKSGDPFKTPDGKIRYIP